METLKINDGTTMQITRLPDIDDETWAEAFRGAMVENPQASSNSFQTSQNLELEVTVLFFQMFFLRVKLNTSLSETSMGFFFGLSSLSILLYGCV